MRAAYAVEGAPIMGASDGGVFQCLWTFLDGPLMTGISAAKNGKTMKNMGSDLSDLSFKCFCDPDEVFGPVWSCLVVNKHTHLLTQFP